MARTRLSCQQKSDNQSRLCKILSASNVIVNQKYKQEVYSTYGTYDTFYLIVPNKLSSEFVVLYLFGPESVLEAIYKLDKATFIKNN